MNNTISVSMISMEDLIQARCFDVGATIEVMEQALISFKNGRVLLPDKISQIFNEEKQNRINCMPATLLDDKICGVKWVSVFPENPHIYGIPNISGVIILSEIEKGYPFAIMDGSFITAFRTACMGAIGSKYLAHNHSEIMGIIGSGEQAKMHLITMKYVHPEIKVCRIASRSSKSELDFIEKMSARFPDIAFEPCQSDYAKATTDADIIVTAVSCQEPLLKAKTIKDGAFYCHVGGWEDEYDVPLKANKIVCDLWECVKHRTQTISRLYQQKRLSDEDIYSDIVDIIEGSKPGRENDKEFIYFNSVGLAFIDVAVAYHYYNVVKKMKSGTQWIMRNSSIIE